MVCPGAFFSDRDTRFLSSFWKSLCVALDVERCLTSGFYPQANGLAERTNQTVKQILRALTLGQTDWTLALDGAEIAINNDTLAGTGVDLPGPHLWNRMYLLNASALRPWIERDPHPPAFGGLDGPGRVDNDYVAPVVPDLAGPVNPAPDAPVTADAALDITLPTGPSIASTFSREQKEAHQVAQAGLV